MAWEELYQRLLKEEFEWDKAKLSVSEPSLGPQHYIDKESDKKSLNKMKKVKVCGISGVV